MELDPVAREADWRIVYCGPPGAGKTSNLEHLHAVLAPETRGRFITPVPGSQRTFRFDFLSVDLGDIRGYRTRFHLYGLPADVGGEGGRERLLRMADGIVLVLDSGAERAGANRSAVRRLEEGLRDVGRDPAGVEVVLQYNKRDLRDALPVPRMEEMLNPRGRPHLEAVATRGAGVVRTIEEVGTRVLDGFRPGGGAS